MFEVAVSFCPWNALFWCVQSIFVICLLDRLGSYFCIWLWGSFYAVWKLIQSAAACCAWL